MPAVQADAHDCSNDAACRPCDKSGAIRGVWFDLRCLVCGIGVREVRTQVRQGVHSCVYVCSIVSDSFVACLGHVDKLFSGGFQALCSYRRGLPRIISSDNALTFNTADKDMKRKYGMFRRPELKDYYAKHRIARKFIVKKAPWRGGFWERMVGISEEVFENKHRQSGA